MIFLFFKTSAFQSIFPVISKNKKTFLIKFNFSWQIFSPKAKQQKFSQLKFSSEFLNSYQSPFNLSLSIFSLPKQLLFSLHKIMTVMEKRIKSFLLLFSWRFIHIRRITQETNFYHKSQSERMYE